VTLSQRRYDLFWCQDSALQEEMEAKPFACFPEVQPIFAVAKIVQTEWKWKQSHLLTFLRCSLSSRSKDNIFFHTEHKISKKYSKTLKKKQIRLLLNVKSCIFCQKVVWLVRQSSQRVDIEINRQFGWICNPTALIISICNAIIYDFLRPVRSDLQIRQFGWICNPTALIISICNAIIYDFLRLLRIQNPDIKGGRIANPTGQDL